MVKSSNSGTQSYVLQLKEKQLYLHKGLFDLGQLRTQLLGQPLSALNHLTVPLLIFFTHIIGE
jgi:hypothetical protein